jgi:hypothetical protein
MNTLSAQISRTVAVIVGVRPVVKMRNRRHGGHIWASCHLHGRPRLARSILLPMASRRTLSPRGGLPLDEALANEAEDHPRRTYLNTFHPRTPMRVPRRGNNTWKLSGIRIKYHTSPIPEFLNTLGLGCFRRGKRLDTSIRPSSVCLRVLRFIARMGPRIVFLRGRRIRVVIIRLFRGI